MGKVIANFIGLKTGLSQKKVKRLRRLLNFLLKYNHSQVHEYGNNIPMAFECMYTLPDGRKQIECRFRVGPMSTENVACLAIQFNRLPRTDGGGDTLTPKINFEGIEHILSIGLTHSVTPSIIPHCEPLALGGRVEDHLPLGTSFEAGTHDTFHAGGVDSVHYNFPYDFIKVLI